MAFQWPRGKVGENQEFPFDFITVHKPFVDIYQINDIAWVMWLENVNKKNITDMIRISLTALILYLSD